MKSQLRAIVRLSIYAAWTLALLPVQMAAVLTGSRLASSLPRFYHRGCCRIIGIDLVVRGAPADSKPLLIVANHASYLDITVLGALVRGSFVAKAEIAKWPFFGLLAKLQRTVFIERRSAHAAKHRDEIARRLEKGDDLILFPEGTSSDGNRILPFKSALFSVAEREVDGQPLTVQPVSVAYLKLDGLPLGREWRPRVAWYGSMGMLSHAWNLFTLGKLTVEVGFQPPVDLAADAEASGALSAGGRRKLLAERSQAAVEAGFAESLFASGRQG
ncbi:MAG TPA: lysophospholipid acyltransferase family protein [Alphaproteobacteria bacterium]|nr:lysophospholipid acyltransferase family protein [Alphaproteobacteria bacterium]